MVQIKTGQSVTIIQLEARVNEIGFSNMVMRQDWNLAFGQNMEYPYYQQCNNIYSMMLNLASLDHEL